MVTFDPENMEQEANTDATILWKNYHTLSPNFKKNNKGASVVLDWIAAIIEFRLKKDIINSLKTKSIDVKALAFGLII